MRQLKIKREEMIHQLKYLESQTSSRYNKENKTEHNPESEGELKHPSILSKEEHEKLM